MTRRIIRSGPAAAKPCRYCIDGFQPDGTHPVLGPVYTRCSACIAAAILPICPACLDNCWFPADYTCLHCAVEHCAELGYLIILCRQCFGVVQVVPANPEAGGNQP